MGTKSTRVNEVIARPARTAPQAGVAFALVEFIDSFINDLSEKQYGAAVSLLVILFAAVQVALERGIGTAFLRGTTSDGKVPVTRPSAKPTNV